MGRIVALILALIVGGLAGALIVRSASSPPVVAAAGASQVVTLTVTAEPVTPDPVTVTVTAQPAAPVAAPDTSAGSKDNGEFLVGAQISAGNWQCGKTAPETFWETKDSSGTTLDIDFGSIANISADAYSVRLFGCSAGWSKIG